MKVKKLKRLFRFSIWQQAKHEITISKGISNVLPVQRIYNIGKETVKASIAARNRRMKILKLYKRRNIIIIRKPI